MSQNWSRHFELQLLSADGGGISLKGFKVTFKVDWYIGSAPKVAQFKIYNLAPSTVNQIVGKEFAKIRLFAGYEGLTPVVSESEAGVVKVIPAGEDRGQRSGRNYGLIFSGDIRITIDGRDNTPDTWLLVQAIDGHEAIAYATLSATLAKGYTVKDMYDLALAGLKPYHITSGAIPAFPPTTFPRGYTFHGKVSDYLTQLAKLCNSIWELLDDRLEMYQEGYSPHPPIPINSTNGMIGIPQRTTGTGLNVKCLINPNIRLRGKILLNEASIAKTVPNLKELSDTRVEAEKNKNLAANESQDRKVIFDKDGIYQVYGITYSGDTRDKEWYMDLMCELPGSKEPDDATINKLSA